MNNHNIYGYLRVSTLQQELKQNKDSIICLCTELGYDATKILWIEETVSGKKHWKKRKLNEIYINSKKDDIFITSEISRIGRTYLQIMEFLANMLQKGVKIHFTKGSFKVDDSIGSQSMLFAFSISAQLERELISQRTKNALEQRRKEGKHIGRPKGEGKCKLDEHLLAIKNKVESGVKYKVIAKDYNVCPNTISNFIKKNGLSHS